MPRQPSSVHPTLRLSDLTSHPVQEERLLSIRLPIELINRLDHACRVLRARKGEVVVAMLNEGLESYQALNRPKRQPRKTKAPAKKRQRKARSHR